MKVIVIFLILVLPSFLYAQTSSGNNEGKSQDATSQVNSSDKSFNSSAIDKIAKDIRLRDDEVQAINIIGNSKDLNEAFSKLKEKNIEKLNNYTLEALNKLTDEIPNFPITGSEIQSLLNGGSFKEVLKNFNYRVSNKLAQDLRLDYNQTQVLNIIATSENKEEILERLEQNNIQQISQTTADGLQKMLRNSYKDFPINSADITDMLNGNFQQAFKNIEYNRNMNTITEGFGGDREMAESSVATVNLLGNHLDEIARKKSNSLFQEINIFYNNYNSTKKKYIKKPISYTANFEDNYWRISENKYFKPKIIEKNILEIEFKGKPEFDDISVDNLIFAKLEIPGLNLVGDFKIDFEMGYLIDDKLYQKYIYAPPYIGLFLSETNRLTIEPYGLNFRYCFTPIFNQFSKYGGDGKSEFTTSYPKIDHAVRFGHTKWDDYEFGKEYRAKLKLVKEHYQKVGKYFSENSNQWFFLNYHIEKKGEKISIICSFYNEDLNYLQDLFKLENIDFNFLDSSNIFLGAASMYTEPGFYKMTVGGGNNEIVRIRNFQLEQY